MCSSAARTAKVPRLTVRAATPNQPGLPRPKQEIEACPSFDLPRSGRRGGRRPRHPPRPRQTDSVTIGYGDLNLASQAGRAALDQRIDGAARQLCGEASPLELKMVALGRACRAGVASPMPARSSPAVIVDDQFASLTVSRAAF